MNQIQIKDINLGGIANSQYQGQKNSVAEMVGFDIHSEPGILKNNQKLTQESGGLVDDLVKKILPCSDGNSYLFGSTNGKIWKRTSAGVYSLEATASPSAGSAGIIDAWEYQGYIYYTMQSRLGRVAVASPTNWTGRDDNWKTFSNTDDTYHPCQEVNAVLYIGDGNFVSQVDAGVFSADALDIEKPYRIASLGKSFTNLLIGTFVNTYRVWTSIFNWNTWSIDSFQSSDDIPEIGVSCFLKTDNFNLVYAGLKGNFYLYTGTQLEQYKRIPGDWTGSNTAIIYPNASCNMFGLPLFGLSNLSGNPAKQGIYSLGGYDRNYPKVLNLEWLISTGAYSGIDIGCVELVGNQLLVSWKQQTTITMIIDDPCVVSMANHGLVTGSPIKFATTGSLPTGITAGTTYYVRSVDANTFHLYDTSAHAVAGGTTGRIATTGTQSGIHTATVWGVDKVDSTAKVSSAYFTTRIINVARGDKKDLAGFVSYRSLPTGTSIKVYYKVNYANDWTEATTVVDTDRKIIEVKDKFPEANTLQIKVESNANDNNAPEIEGVEFSFE
ncbi:MAG: hypothetical protein KBG30_09890 [Bacteroidales bacterium]|nr:hypothetical protein [Bacteroidales bacterium]